MKGRESVEDAAIRWDELRLVQEHYKNFLDFLEDVMVMLGFSVTDIQADIAGFLVYGPKWLMVQAQRSQAKTTIAAAFAVWCLIHSPAHRVLIVSAGGTQANEISTLIVRIILTMDVLECMRPDKMAGDRTSTEAFDVHHSLKGVDKSPSVACVGIGANLQGKRADLLIADDVESAKNSLTAHMRAQLLDLTKDFVSIAVGRIVWLGTPQSGDSIYNTLPARGVTVRIWPGRYPTEEQMKNYGDHLAPLLVERIKRDPTLQTGGGLLGTQGKPIDPELLDEGKLQAKELNQGEAFFQLQHMLNTRLTDAQRYPLKPEKLVLLDVTTALAPLQVIRSVAQAVKDLMVGDFPFRISLPHSVSAEMAKYELVWSYVDPAAGGANGDETAYAVGGFLNGNVYLLAVGAVQGGYEDHKLDELATKLLRFPISGVTIEKNLGYGAFATIFTTKLVKKAADLGVAVPSIEDDLVSGMKEARIIETLEPVMGRGSLIVTSDCLEEDRLCCARYSTADKQLYSFVYQLAKMQKVRNALVHDDRADAIEGLVRRFQKLLVADQDKAADKHRAQALQEAMHRAMPKVFKPLAQGSSINSRYFKR
jgi:hypothetical protein